MQPVKPLQIGDIIFTDYIHIRHYGVYAGKGRVIHHAGENSIFDANIGIREISLMQFAKDKKFVVVQFVENHAESKNLSREEAVRHVRSRMGERSYNLIFNNCEHFALWCKTGKSKSIQVERAITVAIVLGTIAVGVHLAKSNEGKGKKRV